MLNPNAQKTTSQTNKTRTRRTLRKSNLVIVDTSRSSSRDQVLRQTKRKTTRSVTRTNTPASDQVRTTDQMKHKT